MNNRQVLAYAAGPGDVVETFRQWQQGIDDPHQVAITYSGQFFNLCRNLDCKGVIISSNPRADVIRTDQFHVENVPAPPPSSGFQFHRQQVQTSYRFLKKARALGANVFVISDATGHWFPFTMAKKAGELFIPSIHCVLWSRFSKVSHSRRMLNFMERSFFKSNCAGILAVSKDVANQVATVAGDPSLDVQVFHPTYRPGTFSSVPPPPSNDAGFTVFFAGRLESEKGIYELLEVAKRVHGSKRADIRFDILGNGSEEQTLREQATKAGLDNIFTIHGYCERDKLLTLLGKSHTVVVPTSTRFHEGFNKVVAEGVLSGRPVITSSACPALHSVKDAVIEVVPDDIDSLYGAIIQLADDHQLYERKQQACATLAPRFYDPAASWGTSLENILKPELMAK